MINISASCHSLMHDAQEIAFRWGFVFTESTPHSHYLQLRPEGLCLCLNFEDHKPQTSLLIDFTEGKNAHRRQQGGGKKQALARAVGLDQYTSPLIIDATAGLGSDAFVFASLGATVHLYERNPVIAALLENALQRARSHAETIAIISRMTLHFQDSITGLQAWENQTARPDIIYLDPMFPERKKSAKVKKQAQILQLFAGKDEDSALLLDLGRKIAAKRVAVKRPLKASFIGNVETKNQIKMKNSRFDLYLPYNR